MSSTKEAFKPPDWFLETRKKGPSPIGTALFTALRILDLPLQYYLLSSGLAVNIINRLGGATVVQSNIATTATLGLSRYHTLVLSLAIGSSLKHIYYSNIISQQIFPVSIAAGIAFANVLADTINALLSLWNLTSQQPDTQSSLTSFLSSSSLAIRVGLPLYLLGLFVEWYSEVQRSRFKARPENNGKPYSSGLFGLARNINYGGYTLWRTGAALVCGMYLIEALTALLSSLPDHYRLLQSHCRTLQAEQSSKGH